MEKLKLVIYHNVIGPYKVPFFEGIAKHFPGEIVLFTSSMFRKHHKEWELQKLNARNITVRYLPAINSPFLGTWYNPGIFWNVFKENFDLLMTGDYMFLSAMLSLWAAKLKRKPVVLYTEATKPLTLRGDLPISKFPLADKIYKLVKFSPLVYRSLLHYDLYIAPSQASIRHLVSQGIPQERIRQIYNPVDINMFHPRPPDKKWQQQLGISDRDVVITFVGRLVPGKGVDLLVRAFAELTTITNQSIKLCLVGEGELKRSLIGLVKELGIEKNVCFVGYVPHDRVPQLHSITDIFVLPSIPQRHNIEQFPNALLEAIASGLPCVVFDIPAGFKDYIQDSINGIMIKDISHQALAHGLSVLVQDSGLRSQLGQRARQTAEENFSPGVIGKQYVEVLMSLCPKG